MTGTAPVIGVDESGKGDYFGPLVIAGVLVDDKSTAKLENLKIRDSKLISDNRVKVLAKEILKYTVSSVVVILPEKYNELHAKMKNLNKMLAWGHARVIEDLLEKRTDCNRVISDKFGKDSFIKSALMEKGKTAELLFETKAEKYFAVAAASVLARAVFLKELEELSKTIGFILPKGASKEAESGAEKLYRERGFDIFNSIAKVHFKTTQKIKAKETLFR